jgi:hypothetical protein
VQLNGHHEIPTDPKGRCCMKDFLPGILRLVQGNGLHLGPAAATGPGGPGTVTHGNKGQLIHGFQLNSALDAE